MSYVRSHSTRDLNDYDQFFGNFRNPIIRAERELAQPDRRAQPADRPRHDRPAGQVGLLAALRVAHGLPVVGGRRIPGFRRRAQPSRAAADRVDARLHAGAAVALPEVPLHRPASRSTTPSTPATSATCRTTSRRRTTARSTTRFSARSDSSCRRRSHERCVVQPPRKRLDKPPLIGRIDFLK